MLILPDAGQTLRGLSPCASGLRLWCCRLREKRELPSRGEGLGLLDNPKSAWSSHAKAAASGKDTRVLNLQNKARRTWDLGFPPCSSTKVHIFAHYSLCKREDLGALESCNLPVRLHLLQSCNTVWASHKGENPPNGKTSYENWNEVITQAGRLGPDRLLPIGLFRNSELLRV